MIVTCLIAPNGNGHNCKTSYVKFIENLDEVDSYAWGAAMLSCSYQGMKRKMEEGKLFDGILWLIIGFFFHHFKGLIEIFQINVEQVTMPQAPMLLS
ncbi:hypothetical protein A2U01_0047432, partial [Trifolium medium]|nr:hypothetical protein [Trifolium medium]